MTKLLKSTFLQVLVTAAIAGAACSDNDNNNVPQQGTQDGGFGGAGGAVVDGGTGGATGTFIITISNFTFSPTNLDVPAGATVTVQNMDAVPHTVTSQSMPGQFVPGAVAGVAFDTGIINGTVMFTIPTTAPSGTVVPYFCMVHKNGMRNQPQITIH
jgi:plastocyanin